MIRLIIYILVALLISCFHVFAQEMPWPSEMEDIAKEHYVQLSDDCRLENFESAVSLLNWLRENVPDLHVSVYQNGLTAYRSLVKVEQDPDKKADPEKKCLMMER